MILPPPLSLYIYIYKQGTFEKGLVYVVHTTLPTHIYMARFFPFFLFFFCTFFFLFHDNLLNYGLKGTSVLFDVTYGEMMMKGVCVCVLYKFVWSPTTPLMYYDMYYVL